MACIENLCSNLACKWYQFSNEKIVFCPMCGEHALNYFDEDNNESPTGDDYLLEDEDE